MSPPNPNPAQTWQHGRYTSLGILGQGGFGITHLAEDALLQRKVAIKEFFLQGSTRVGPQVLPPSGVTPGELASQRQKFVEEARALARFSHPSIVRVQDVFEEGGTALIVMEHLNGHTLQKHLSQHGPLSFQHAEDLTTSLLEALEEVHKQGLLHRDIKPDNIFLVSGRPVLIDFGAARQVGGSNQPMTAILTPGFAPPEQYLSTGGVKYGPPTDLYALAATLVYSLTGQLVPAAHERMMQPVPLPELPAGLKARFKSALLQSLELRIASRPATAQAFMDILQEKTSSGPKPPPPIHDPLEDAVVGHLQHLKSQLFSLKHPANPEDDLSEALLLLLGPAILWLAWAHHDRPADLYTQLNLDQLMLEVGMKQAAQAQRLLNLHLHTSFSVADIQRILTLYLSILTQQPDLWTPLRQQLESLIALRGIPHPPAPVGVGPLSQYPAVLRAWEVLGQVKNWNAQQAVTQLTASELEMLSRYFPQLGRFDGPCLYFQPIMDLNPTVEALHPQAVSRLVAALERLYLLLRHQNTTLPPKTTPLPPARSFTERFPKNKHQAWDSPEHLEEVCFSKGAQLMALRSQAGTVQVVETISRTLLWALPVAGATAVAFDPVEPILHVLHSNKVTSWQVFERHKLLDLPLPHSPLQGLCAAPNVVLTSNLQGELLHISIGKVWQTPALVMPVSVLAMSALGKICAFVTHRGREIQVLRPPNPKPFRTLPITGEATAMALDKEGRRLAVGFQSGVVQVFDLATGDQVSRWTVNSRVHTLHFQPAGEYLLVSSQEGQVLLYKSNTATLEARTQVNAAGRVWASMSEGLQAMAWGSGSTAQILQLAPISPLPMHVWKHHGI